MAALGFLGGVLFLIVGIVQVYVGFIGIEYHLGSVVAFAALFLAFFLRIMFPLTIGTFFGALSVWGWPWYGAAALAAPGLLFIVPALVTGAVSTLFEKKVQNNYSQSFSSQTSESEPKNITPKKKTKKIIIRKKIIKKRKKLNN